MGLVADMRTLYLEHRSGATYSYISPFHPSKKYPEYPWGINCLSLLQNDAYDMVRELLYQIGLDANNFGKSNWNPFGSFITPGMTVLVKPNMVLSWHPGGNDPNLDTMITNPSVVRAVVDYIVIALEGTGSIIIGDAPLQSCDFDKLVANMGYKHMLDFYKLNGVNLSYVDFRQVRSRYNDTGILETSEAPGDPLGYKVVDMGNLSAHASVRNHRRKFRVTNYDHRKMLLYHTAENDRYLIAGTALSADVIISMPKLKTHRKAGMTGAMKNFIGIIGHKDCLPHHRKGSVEEGGDEYLKSNFFKRLAVFLEEWFNIFSISNFHWIAKQVRKGVACAWSRAWSKNTDPYSEGSWYGNDTIWRTTHDLVRIARYADRFGNMKKTPQRTIFTLVDAIIAGEKEGPLIASPLHAGFLAAGFDLAALDMVLASIMGFDHKKIPTILEAFKCTDKAFTSLSIDDVLIETGNRNWNGKTANSIGRNDSLLFEPTSGWLGHIEKNL